MIIWAESFEMYGGTETAMLAGLWAELGQNTLLISDGTARTGSWHLSTGGGVGIGSLRRAIPASLFVGLTHGWRFPTLPSSDVRNGVSFRAGTTAICTVVIKSDGTIQFKSGGYSGTVLGTADETVVAGGWYHFECKLTISATVGSMEIRLNGVTCLSLSDLNLGTTACDNIAWDNGGSTSVTHLDDIVVWDASGGIADDFLGPVRVDTIRPTTDSTPADWSLTGAASFAAATDDTTPDDDTTYAAALDALDQHAINFGDLPADVTELVGFFLVTRMKQADSGITKVQATVISNAVEEAGDEHSITDSYQYWTDAFGLNPDTGLPYTKAEFEAIVLRYERTV